MMETSAPPRGARGRGGTARRGHHPRHTNPAWTGGGASGSDGERWERGGHRGGGRARKPNMTWRKTDAARALDADAAGASGTEEEATDVDEPQAEAEVPQPAAASAPIHLQALDEPALETAEERERFYKQLTVEREADRKRAIAEGKMDDPLVPKRLEDAIAMVGTCQDMCPRFERYRRERENNLDRLEVIPGTKRVDHARAVKIYERAAGDKTLPSDLRPPPVLKRTLDYLFRYLPSEKGFLETQAFVRDRSRAVRSDFTIQHLKDTTTIECHDRCVRFHILSLHHCREKPGFDVVMEDQLLMNTLQSLLEFYEDNRGTYESPTELEMRVYHRLIHIRDEKERNDGAPEHIRAHPVYELTSSFRKHVQDESRPITKKSALKVGAAGMQIFGALAARLREAGNVVMIYLVACLLERHFGKGTIEGMEAIHGGMTLPDIIDGVAAAPVAEEAAVGEFVEEVAEDAGMEAGDEAEEQLTDIEDEVVEEDGEDVATEPASSFAFGPTTSSSPFGSTTTVATQSAFGSTTPGFSAGSAFGQTQPAPKPASGSAFGNLTATPNVFGTVTSAFGGPSFGAGAQKSVFGNGSTFSAGGPSNASTAPSFGTSAPAQPASTTTLFGVQPAAPVPGPAKPQAPSVNVTAPTPPLAPSPSGAALFGSSTQAPAPAPSTSVAGGAPPNLNPFAPSFVPGAAHKAAQSQTTQPVPPAPAPAPAPVPAPTAPAASSDTAYFALPPAATPGAAAPTNDSPTPFVPPIVTTPQASTSTIPRRSSRAIAAPSPLKIDTSLGAKSDLLGFASARPASGLATPTVPPQLGRLGPVSLPGTPTLSMPVGPTPLRPAGTLLNFPKMTSTQSFECLSPLIPSSPSATPRSSFIFSPGPAAPVQRATPAAATPREKTPPVKSPPLAYAPAVGSPLRPSIAKSDKGKERAVDPEESLPDPAPFARRGLAVRTAFRTWQQRAAYKAAVRRSDADRARRSPRRRAPSEVPTEKEDSREDVRERRRARRRVSSGYKPQLTDEELARRFKENSEEHEKRWAAGTFLKSLRSLLTQSPAKCWPAQWQMWVSLNPDSDATAIWLERKFDMPKSGAWVNKQAFAIPAANEGLGASPGLVVFECTPLEGVEDEIERKYRILDDCSRLRDVVEAFPNPRQFLPALLLIIWGEEGTASLHADMFAMIQKFMGDQMLSGHTTLTLQAETKDVDLKFGQVLKSIDLDVTGKLAQPLTFSGLIEHLLEPSRTFQVEWISKCSRGRGFHWPLFNTLLIVVIRALNIANQYIAAIWGSTTKPPAFRNVGINSIVNSSSAYSTIITWLEQKALFSATSSLIGTIRTTQSAGNPFPAPEFCEYLPKLASGVLENRLGVTGSQERLVSKAMVTEALDEIQWILEEASEELVAVLEASVTPEPELGSKRRADEVDGSDDSDRSLSLSPKENGVKRLRTEPDISMDISDGELSFFAPLKNGVNGYGHARAPSESMSPGSVTDVSMSVDGDKPAVTVAMLRALTASVRQKYGKGAK